LCILPRKINRIRANKKINLYLRNNNFQISTTLEVWICFFVILPAMDLRDQLKNLFPQHQPSNESEEVEQHNHELFIQKEPMICKYEKRKGKATSATAKILSRGILIKAPPSNCHPKHHKVFKNFEYRL
jgi:hypothetical protein